MSGRLLLNLYFRSEPLPCPALPGAKRPPMLTSWLCAFQSHLEQQLGCLPPQDIRRELDRSKAVDVVANREGQQRAQPQERHHLEALLANGLVNR